MIYRCILIRPMYFLSTNSKFDKRLYVLSMWRLLIECKSRPIVELHQGIILATYFLSTHHISCIYLPTHLLSWLELSWNSWVILDAFFYWTCFQHPGYFIHIRDCSRFLSKIKKEKRNQIISLNYINLRLLHSWVQKLFTWKRLKILLVPPPSKKMKKVVSGGGTKR